MVCCFGPKDLLMKAIKCLSYNKIAPMPVKEASISATNTLLKYGKART